MELLKLLSLLVSLAWLLVGFVDYSNERYAKAAACFAFSTLLYVQATT